MVEDKTIKKHSFSFVFYELNFQFEISSIIEFLKKTNFTKGQQLSTFVANNQIIEEQELYQFKQNIFSFISDFTINVLKKEKFSFLGSWFQAYCQGDFHDCHTHGNTSNQYSLLLYIQASELSSPTIFYPPGHPYLHEFGEIKIQPVKNKILIFPSCIPHTACPNKDDQRIIFSANFQVS